ncbi:Gfo/Idh/MocA family protein [Streptomyces sp. NPDC093546]|uniref:Gfo/Idh/MocA family protein n=1 Tax=Streptomyces sp. NPDC093546 TaxID=3366040 RepID=UPI003803335B
MSGPLRVGVVGAGWGAGLHLEGFRRTGRVRLAVLTSRTQERAGQLAARFGVEEVVDSLDELIEKVDVVSVATPPDAHHDAVLRAAAAGRHVLCDKPVAVRADQAREMLEAAEKAGVVHATGFVWRYDPAFAAMARAVAAGAIGRPLHVRVASVMGLPPLPYNWMYRREDGGGALMQHGSHVLDRIRVLLGEELTLVRGELHHDLREAEDGPRFHHVLEVFDWARRNPAPVGSAKGLPVTADTGYELSGTTASGVRVSVYEAWHASSRVEESFAVHGTEGSLEWSGADGPVLLRPGRDPEAVDVPGGGSSSGAGAAREHGLMLWHRFADSFVTAVRTRGGHPAASGPEPEGTAAGPLPTLDDGLQVMRIVEAVHASHRSRHEEHV